MHMRSRLTMQPKGGPFDKRVPNPSDTLGRSPTGEPARPKTTRLDTGLGTGADGVHAGTFSGASRKPPVVYSPTRSTGGGSTPCGVTPNPAYRTHMPLIGDTSKYANISHADKRHDPRTLGRPAPYAPGREIEQWQQEAPQNATKPMTIRGTLKMLNQIAPGSQMRNQ